MLIKRYEANLGYIYCICEDKEGYNDLCSCFTQRYEYADMIHQVSQVQDFDEFCEEMIALIDIGYYLWQDDEEGLIKA